MDIPFQFVSSLESPKTFKKYIRLLKKIGGNNSKVEQILENNKQCPMHIHCYKNDKKIINHLNKKRIPINLLINMVNSKTGKDYIMKPNKIINQKLSGYLKLLNQGGGYLPENYTKPYFHLYNKDILNESSVLIYENGYISLREHICKKRNRTDFKFIIKRVKQILNKIRKEMPRFKHNNLTLDYIFIKDKNIKICLAYNSSVEESGKNNDRFTLNNSLIDLTNKLGIRNKVVF